MVRKQLREKSAKIKKVPISKTEPTSLNPAKLSRGQRKRLVNKTHVMAKKSLAVLSLLKGKDKQKQIKQVVEQLSTEPSDNQTFKELIKEPEKKKQNKSRGAPKSQQKRNLMLLNEMQRFQSVLSNEHVKKDPYEAVRQYLEARNVSK